VIADQHANDRAPLIILSVGEKSANARAVIHSQQRLDESPKSGAGKNRSACIDERRNVRGDEVGLLTARNRTMTDQATNWRHRGRRTRLLIVADRQRHSYRHLAGTMDYLLYCTLYS